LKIKVPSENMVSIREQRNCGNETKLQLDVFFFVCSSPEIEKCRNEVKMTRYNSYAVRDAKLYPEIIFSVFLPNFVFPILGASKFQLRAWVAKHRNAEMRQK
jgi:hypothetical protein